MSITFYKFSCDKCSFKGDSLVTFGRFLWSHDGDVFQFDRRMGLCEDCDEIVAMEQFPDANTIKRAREIRASHKGAPLGWRPGRDNAEYLGTQPGFELLEGVLDLNRPPVCLKCGSSAVFPIKLPNNISDQTPCAIGVKHPGCQGDIKVQGSGGMRMGMKPITYIYDINGKLITTLSE